MSGSVAETAVEVPMLPLALVLAVVTSAPKVAALAVGAGAEQKLGPPAAYYVLISIVIRSLVHRFPDRRRSEQFRGR